MVDEIVTICAGCGSNRYCREYKGIYVCLSGSSHCWRRREAIHMNKRNEEEQEGKER